MGGVKQRMPLGCLAENHLPVTPIFRFPGSGSPAPRALKPGAKAVGSSTSSGSNCPSTPPFCVTHASSLLPKWRVTAQKRGSWKVTQHPLITLVSSRTQHLNLASRAWAQETQLLPPQSPPPWQRQENEAGDWGSHPSPCSSPPGAGSGIV